ncbi:MAG TPA: metal-sensitive transcriptional regulator [Limnochorda sp.]
MRRIEGQARGIQRMLQEGRSCYEVVMQLAAMRAALSKVAMALIADNLEQCIAQGSDPRASMEQARELLMKFS